MSILESMELAVKNILSSKTRTLLTMLGIIIGVAAVIVIVGLGNGLEKYVSDSFSDLGTDTLTSPSSPVAPPAVSAWRTCTASSRKTASI